MNFSAQFQYTFEEFQSAVREINKHVRKHSKASANRRRGIYGWVLFVGLAVFLFLMLNKTNARPSSAPAARSAGNGPWDILIPIAPWLLVFGFIWFFVFRAVRGREERVWNNSPPLHRPRTLQVAEDGLIFSDPTAEYRLKWDHYIRFAETKDLFLLFMTESTADFIPKRIFVDAAEMDAFRGLLERNISAPTGAFPVVPISQSAK